jgi:hypothetical protein
MERLPDGSALLHDPESDAIYAITVTAAIAWDLYVGGSGIEEIAERLARLFEVSVPDARRDLTVLLDQLAGLGLIERDGR